MGDRMIEAYTAATERAVGSPTHGQKAGRYGIADGADAVMTHHTVALDGAVWSVWRCIRCGRELGKFGAGMPVATADCAPRRWVDGAAW